jgi:hypothetical protein
MLSTSHSSPPPSPTLFARPGCAVDAYHVVISAGCYAFFLTNQQFLIALADLTSEGAVWPLAVPVDGSMV